MLSHDLFCWAQCFACHHAALLGPTLSKAGFCCKWTCKCIHSDAKSQRRQNIRYTTALPLEYDAAYLLCMMTWHLYGKQKAWGKACQAVVWGSRHQAMLMLRWFSFSNCWCEEQMRAAWLSIPETTQKDRSCHVQKLQLVQ